MLPIKTTLLVNGISSGATGIALIAFADQVAQLFGVQITAPFTLTGLFLVVFALFVISAGLKKIPSRIAVQFITALDIIWVVVSILLVLADGSYMTVVGNGAILAVAAWVALMAVLQSKASRDELQYRNA
jgi:Na+/alanine symporter